MSGSSRRKFSSDDDDALRDAAMSAGAWGYVLKDNLLDLARLLEPIKQGNPGQPGIESVEDET